VLALHEAFVPEVILVHYLPSRSGRRAPSGPLAYARAMSGAIAALRRDHFDLQLELLRRGGVPVAVVTSELDELGPGRLARGPTVAEDAYRSALAALTGPAREVG
jgi:NTE family protein